MSLRGFSTASARREFALLRARPWDLAMITWVPLLAVLLIWWIFSAGLPERLPIGVLDQDRSALSRQIVRFLDATPGLRVVQRFDDEGAMARALTSGAVDAAVQLPRDLNREVKQGRVGQVVLLHNAQLGTHSSLIQRDVRTVVATVSGGVELAVRNKRGESMIAARATMEPLKAGTVALFNTSGDYEQFLGAALIPALLHILAMTAGAWAVGRELRDRSIGGWLGAAPRWHEALAALAGKLALPFASLSLVGITAMLWITTGRGWHPVGSLGWTLFALVVFLALSIALGGFVAALTRSLRTALSATGFITAPAFAFGGVGFPLVAMPALAQLWAALLPYTHYVRVQMEQLQMGAPLAYSAATPLWMVVGTAVLLAATATALGRAARAPDSWGGR
ncbi:ABC transporter [Variovorax paradoxus]|jgi:ABC-2 type transport system permease protein|uniref:ABC transporter permease n=1 Tax=Variovorax paradoxus TaxID=34073 RepID=UPI0006E56186|nr:ABC transporter [Variovorax paradoxus]KPV09586.1 ABC transporter [Variovorax paradoxus]KPV12349.1 ABC transporter [Variovorax paradoxus]KPV23757.1 ABC transporter [Variovorax paradoxus]KPV31804.1 ABC transporter [Variovorax paradoxus]